MQPTAWRRVYLRTAIAIVVVAAPQLPAQATARDSAEVHAALTSFLKAFEDLDWERFHTAFADDVTAFFPTPEPPQRFVGRPAVETQFRRVFEAIRKSAATGPPYQHLPPVDLRIEMLSPRVALVSFELRNEERIGRRTLVLRRDAGGWRITHLHASNVSVAPHAPPGA